MDFSLWPHSQAKQILNVGTARIYFFIEMSDLKIFQIVGCHLAGLNHLSNAPRQNVLKKSCKGEAVHVNNQLLLKYFTKSTLLKFNFLVNHENSCLTCLGHLSN